MTPAPSIESCYTTCLSRFFPNDNEKALTEFKETARITVAGCVRYAILISVNTRECFLENSVRQDVLSIGYSTYTKSVATGNTFCIVF